MLKAVVHRALGGIGRPRASLLRRIRLVSFDIEGVYTDGLKHFTPEGWTGMTFHTRDSFGLELLLRAGYEVALISSAQSDMISERARTLGVRHIYVGVRDKGSVLVGIRNRLGINIDEALHVGDDLGDLAAYGVVGMKVAVRDAVAEVRREATWIVSATGGRGAVREVADTLCRARGIDLTKLALGEWEAGAPSTIGQPLRNSE